MVELAPGIGTATGLILERDPREWSGVEPDPLAADHLERAVRGPGREVVRAPVDATGLDDASASVVTVDALLSTLDDDGARAVLAEARRVLRPGGRVSLHELAPAAGGGGPRGRRGPRRRRRAAALRGGAARPGRGRGVRGDRLAHGAARAAPASGADARGGARGRPCRRRARSRATATCAGAATASRRALERAELSLRSALVVAEVPLVLGMRRPRRGPA